MTTSKWIAKNTTSLAGKTVAISGATGGLGGALCEHIAALGASLILLDRNAERSAALREELSRKYGTAAKSVIVDMEDMTSVREACDALRGEPIDVLIHNAGAYKIPRRICESRYDNVFQINFASPYYITHELLPMLRERRARVVAVGSIAHDYSKYDPSDVDFHTRERASRVYGNSKRYLMFALEELFREEKDASLSVAHPGISYTNITSHYPKVIFALIKHPMKVIFPKPKRASLAILRGVFEPCGDREWIGPRFFDVWGTPRRRSLTSCSEAEEDRIFADAEDVYRHLKAM